MRRAIVVIVLALTMLVAAACPVIAAVAQPSPTERFDRVDFNGDGFDDLAIGVPGEGIGGAALAGAVNILYGGASGLAGTNRCSPGQSEPVDLFGFTVAGDFNADGFTDLWRWGHPAKTWRRPAWLARSMSSTARPTACLPPARSVSRATREQRPVRLRA
jgi:hypothetical protein